MLQLENYLEFKQIVGDIICEESATPVGDNSKFLIQDDKIFIDTRFVTIAIPLNEIRILTPSDKEILVSKDFYGIYKKYKTGKVADIKDDVIELIKKYKDRVEDKEYKNEIEAMVKSQSIDFKINLRKVEIHPPAGSKLKASGVSIYIVLDEVEALIHYRGQQSTGVLTKLKIGDLVFNKIGRVNVKKFIKYYLSFYEMILKCLCTFIKSFVGMALDGEFDIEKIKGVFLNSLKDVVKKYIDKIKKLDKVVELDKSITNEIADKLISVKKSE